MNALLKGSEYEEKLQKQENFDGILVIGAGLPRTGTLSTRLALAQLLKGKVYHMNNLAQVSTYVQKYIIVKYLSLSIR